MGFFLSNQQFDKSNILWRIYHFVKVPKNLGQTTWLIRNVANSVGNDLFDAVDIIVSH